MYFDTHAHYDDERFDEDRIELLQQINSKGVKLIVNAAADMKGSEDSITLAKTFDFIYASVGVHPHEVKELQDKDLEQLKVLSKYEKVVAIGEIGLDYHYDFSPREVQKEWFKRQLKLAREVSLPVIIHSREACQDTFDIIKDSGVSQGVIHSYSGSLELAKEYVKRGFYIGIGGVVTFKNAKKAIEVVEGLPIESIVIETDAPYLTPVPHRGKRNDSGYLSHVVEKIAEIKGLNAEEVERITYNNGIRLFNIKI